MILAKRVGGTHLPFGRVVISGLALASLGAGLIHFSAAPDHASWPLHVGFFVAAGVAQVLWAALVLRRASRPVLSVGAAGNLALVGVWLLSRTSGIGFAPGAETVEPVGFKDAVAVFLELSVAAGVGLLAVLPREGRELLLPKGRAAVGAVVAGVALMTAAGLGLAPPYGHERAAGELAGHAHRGGKQGDHHGGQPPPSLARQGHGAEEDHTHTDAFALPEGAAHVHEDGPGHSGSGHAHHHGDQSLVGLARHAHGAPGDRARPGTDARAHEHASGPTEVDEGHRSPGLGGDDPEGHHHGADSDTGGPGHDQGHEGDHDHDHDGGSLLDALTTFIEETSKMLGLGLL